MVIESSGLIGLLVWIIIIGCIFGLLWWLIGYVGLPEPFNKVARVVVAVIAVLLLINVLLGLVGAPLVRLK